MGAERLKHFLLIISVFGQKRPTNQHNIEFGSEIFYKLCLKYSVTEFKKKNFIYILISVFGRRTNIYIFCGRALNFMFLNSAKIVLVISQYSFVIY